MDDHDLDRDNDREYRSEYRRLTQDVKNLDFDGRRRYGYRAMKYFPEGMEFEVTFWRFKPTAVGAPADLEWTMGRVSPKRGYGPVQAMETIHGDSRVGLYSASEVVPRPVVRSLSKTAKEAAMVLNTVGGDMARFLRERAPEGSTGATVALRTIVTDWANVIREVELHLRGKE